MASLTIMAVSSTISESSILGIIFSIGMPADFLRIYERLWFQDYLPSSFPQ
jgi:hypothetical protein